MPPARRRPPAPEDALLNAVMDLCLLKHVRAVHFPKTWTPRGRVITAYRGDGKGWPDLHVLGRGGVLYRELKSATGTVERDQRRYLDDLRAAGCDADVWRPVDLVSGRIEMELDAIRRPSVTVGACPGPAS